MLQQEKLPAIAHTCNDGEDEREAEEEERMVMKLCPIKSTQTIVIGAGSEPVGLKCRHDGVLDIEGIGGKIQMFKASHLVKAPLRFQAWRSSPTRIPYRAY